MATTKNTKETILKETFRLLLIKGYDAVSITDIQKASNTARGLLYHYFGNKEQLFFEVAEHFLLQQFAIRVDALSALSIKDCITHMVAKYDKVCRAISQEVDQEQSITIANYDFLIYRITQENKQFAQQYKAIRQDEITVWKTILQREKECGKLWDRVDTLQSAQHFVYLFDGVWLSTVSCGSADQLHDTLTHSLSQYYLLLKK